MSDDRIIAGLKAMGQGLASMAQALDSMLKEIKGQQESEGPRTRAGGTRKKGMPRVQVVISMADVMTVLSRMEEEIAGIRTDLEAHWRDFLAHDHPQPKPTQLRIGEQPAQVSGPQTPTTKSAQRAAEREAPLPPLPHTTQQEEAP